MTKKTLIAQGMRLCFPEDMGGMPYVDAEIIDAEPTTIPLSAITQDTVIENTIESPKAIMQNPWISMNAWLRVASIKDNYIKKSYTKKEVPTAK